MNKRDKFIAELREEARGKGLSFRAETWRGKGGHMMVFRRRAANHRAVSRD
jgi:hypothetical protein